MAGHLHGDHAAGSIDQDGRPPEPASRYVFDQDSDEAVLTRVRLLGPTRSLGARLGTAHLHTVFLTV